MFIFISIQALAQQNKQDVVYLKNGNVVRGKIIEQELNVSIKIQTVDSSVFVFKMEDINKITKEHNTVAKSNSNNPNEVVVFEGFSEGPIELEGRHLYQNSESKTIQEIKSILKSNPASEHEIKIYNSKTTVRSIFTTVGSLTVLTGAGLSLSNSMSQASTFNSNHYVNSASYLGVYAGGFALEIIGLIAGAGSRKHLRKSIEQYNASLKKTPRLPSFYSSNDSITNDSVSEAPHYKPALTNDKIIQMTDKGLSTALIIEKIRQEPNAFDLSPQAIRLLNRKLVAIEVIEEMKKSKKP